MEELVFEVNPRTVSRGLKLQPAFLGVDSLYLVIEYPSTDVFDYWSSGVNDTQDRRLHDGIPHGKMLIRRGAHGYKLSVWSGDARLFITDRVDNALVDTPAAGHGMGLLLQLGSKWLRMNADFTSYETLSASIFNLLRDFKLSEPEKYLMRINRLDVALDVAGLAVDDFSIDEWRRGWVGRASGKYFYDDSTTGTLSGFAIGSSKGAVRFKAYDKLLESQKTGDMSFWFMVWANNIDFANYNQRFAITRFEWSIKPHGAKFIGMQYLSDYSFDGLKELLNYVTQKWGRLCISQTDKNQSRWENHPLWEKLRRMMIDEWDIDHVGIAKRDYPVSPDLNENYINSVTGWISGLMARVGLSKGYNHPADIAEAILLANKQSSHPIEEKAKQKWDIFSRLFGGGKDG